MPLLHQEWVNDQGLTLNLRLAATNPSGLGLKPLKPMRTNPLMIVTSVAT
jgi:hypothetical protein